MILVAGVLFVELNFGCWGYHVVFEVRASFVEFLLLGLWCELCC